MNSIAFYVHICVRAKAYKIGPKSFFNPITHNQIIINRLETE